MRPTKSGTRIQIVVEFVVAASRDVGTQGVTRGLQRCASVASLGVLDLCGYILAGEVGVQERTGCRQAQV